MRIRAWIGLVLVALPGTICGTTLPTNGYPWRVVLRDYLATLTASDFSVTLDPMTYDAGYFTNIEDLYRVWIWGNNLGRQVIDDRGLRVSATNFLLNTIEAGGSVNMKVGIDEPGYNDLLDPAAVAWWSQWTYPGNPYRPGTANSLAAKKRAFAAAAVDLIMLSNWHITTPASVRSDYMGGSLVWQAYTYYVVKDILPANVQTSYVAGLTNIFRRIEGVTPNGSGGADMETPQLVGMWYAAEAVGSTNLKSRAYIRATNVLQQIIRPAGYEHHCNTCKGYDSSYSGIALRFLTWAAHLYNTNRITQVVDGMLKLKAHLSLPEPGASGFQKLYVGPSHFNTATADSCHNDQWCKHFRDAAGAMHTDTAKYLLYGGRYYESWFQPLGIRDEATMRADFVSWLNDINNGTYGLTVYSTNTSAPWAEVHWSEGLNYACDHYDTNFYFRAALLRDEGNPLTLPPFLRRGNFVQAFSNDFMAVKIGEYGAIIHTDVICTNWAGHIAGLSGGGLSAFWTPVSGTILLGLNGGSQLVGFETWAGWTNWAVHAISGIDDTVNPFSSARNRDPSNVVYQVNGTTGAVVTFEGKFGGGISAPNNAIQGDVRYYRTILCDVDGLDVKTEVKRMSGTDQARELWEMIPIHLRHTSQPDDAVIEFKTGSVWIAASTALTGPVSSIRVTRFGQPVYFDFTWPRKVKMSPSVAQRSTSRTWNLMVDMLESGGSSVLLPASTTVQYRIYLPRAELRVEGNPGDYGAPSALGYGRYTNSIFETWITNRVALYAGATNGVRHACLGWTAADWGEAVFSNGIGTQALFYVSTNTVLTWRWTNEYYLGATALLNGAISPPREGWHTKGEMLTVTAAPSNYFHFITWRGDIPAGQSTNANPLALTMDRPQGVTAQFGTNFTACAVPEYWLAGYGLTNFSVDETNDVDGDGMKSWEEYFAGTDPTNRESVLHMEAPSPASGASTGIVLRWSSATNRFYSPERATNLEFGLSGFSGLSISNIPGRPPLNIHTDFTVQGQGPFYYRLKAHP